MSSRFVYFCLGLGKYSGYILFWVIVVEECFGNILLNYLVFWEVKRGFCRVVCLVFKGVREEGVDV